MEHVFDIIKYFISSNAHSFCYSCLKLVKCNLLISKLQEQIFVSILQGIFELLTGKFVKTMNELEISSHRSHYSFNFDDHSKLLIAHIGQIALNQQFIPLFITHVHFRRIKINSFS